MPLRKCREWGSRIVSLAPVFLFAGLAAPALGQTQSSVHVVSIANENLAHPVYSAGRVNLIIEKAPLEDVLKELMLAGAPLVYPSHLVAGNQLVSCPCSDVSLATALDRMLRGTKISYQQLQATGQIALLPAPEPTPAKPAVGVVQGRVTAAETGEGLSAVAVGLRGSKFGVQTGSDGSYRIAGVPAGSYIITAQRIGYGSQSRTVTVTADQVSAVDFALAVEVLQLDQLTVTTGTVMPTQLRKLPNTIAVITEDEIAQFQANNVAEIFRLAVPGAIFSDEGAGTQTYGSFSVRGVSTLSGSASNLKIYVDGVEVSDPAYIVNLDMGTVERIEVLRGPQASTIYGTGSTSGVIQIFTKKGQRGSGWRPELSGQFALHTVESPYVGGTPLGQKYGLTVRGGGEHIGYNASVNLNNQPEWIELFKDQATSFFGGTNFDYGKFSGGITLQLKKLQMQNYWNPLYRQMYREIGVAYAAPNKASDHSYQTYGLNLSYAAAPNWRHNLTAGTNSFVNEIYDRTPGADTLYAMSWRNTRRWSAAYNTALQVALGQDLGSTFTFGADYTDYTMPYFSGRVKDRTNYDKGDIDQKNSQSINYGFFGQTQVDFREILFLTAGLRADRNPDGAKDDFTWSPRLGLSAVRDLGVLTAKARVAWGQSVVLPTESQITGMTAPTYEYLPNPDLKAMVQRGYELGADLYYGNRASLSMTYFDQNPLNLIEAVNLGANAEGLTTYQYQNLYRIQNRGWELEGMVQPVEQLNLTVTYGSAKSTALELGSTYVGDLKVGQTIPGRPSYNLSGRITFTPFRGTVLTAAGFHYGGWEAADFYGYLKDLYGSIYAGIPMPAKKYPVDYLIDYPGYSKFNVGLTQVLTNQLTGYLQVNNVGNSAAFERLNMIFSRPRDFTFGLRFQGL